METLVTYQTWNTEPGSPDVLDRTYTKRTNHQCAAIIRQLRWPQYVTCPHCASDRIHPVAKGHAHLCHYYCVNCRTWFNDQTRTGFGRTQLPLWAWFAFIELDAQGVTVSQAAELLPVSQPGIYRIRKITRTDPLCLQIRAHILEPDQYPDLQEPPPPANRPKPDLDRHYASRIDWNVERLSRAARDGTLVPSDSEGSNACPEPRGIEPHD